MESLDYGDASIPPAHIVHRIRLPTWRLLFGSDNSVHADKVTGTTIISRSSQVEEIAEIDVMGGQGWNLNIV